MFCDGYINRDGIPTGGQGVAMVTVTAINAALLIPFPLLKQHFWFYFAIFKHKRE